MGLYDDFEGFGDDEVSERPLDQVVKYLGGAHAETFPAQRVLKSGRLVGDAVYLFRQKKTWAVEVEAQNASEAKQLGKRIQKEVLGPRALASDVPYVYDWDLIVAFSGGFVNMGPTPDKAPKARDTTVQDSKDEIIRRGEETFGPRSVRIVGKEGAYTLSIRATEPRLKKVVRESTVYAASLDEVSGYMDKAIAMVTPLLKSAYSYDRRHQDS
jgi:hypothetical protein